MGRKFPGTGPPDCPVCGKSEGATMNSWRWGHDVGCCSDECGFKMKRRLDELRESAKMKEQQEIRKNARRNIINMVKEVAPNAGRNGGNELKRWL